MTENELYEMVADFGEVYGTGLRRDSYLARGIDWPENWLETVDEIGLDRAKELRAGVVTPSHSELRSLICWQINQALTEANPEITPTIWLCHTPEDDDVLAIEGWGNSLHTELKFRLIGRYPDETTAIIAIRKNYIISIDDVDHVHIAG